MEGKIEMAWSKHRACQIAAEERAAGKDAEVMPYDGETYCVHIIDGDQSGLVARYAGTIQ